MAVSLCRRLIGVKYSVYALPCRATGYVVLIPEVSADIPEKLLTKTDGLPSLSNLTTDECVSALGKCILDYEAEVRNVEDKLKDWKSAGSLFGDVFDPLEKVGDSLDNMWSIAKTMYLANSEVMPAARYVGLHERARKARASKFSSAPIYNACKESIATNKEQYSEEQKRVISKFLLEGRLNGIELQGRDRIRLNETLQKIEMQRSDFRKKIEFTTKKFQHKIKDPNIMRDFPEDSLREMAADSTQPSRGPWTVTLRPGMYHHFLQFCGERELRWNVWQAWVGRGSGNFERNLETSTHVEKLRDLRDEQAKLLGFENFVDMSMETKMAGSAQTVLAMLDSLLKTAKPAQEAELKSLQEFSEERGFRGTLQLWDVPYWKRKQQKTLYSYNEEHLQDFFPFLHVLSGLFSLCERLFGIAIVERPVTDTWHPDVQFFDILDMEKGEPIAGFYIDPYRRDEGKLRVSSDDGWVITLQNKTLEANAKPLAALIFNFPQPLYGKPSLLPFKDVLLLFGKFGHLLQHLLSTTLYSEVSGLSNLEWDAVEVCSNFMTHWVYEPEVLQSLSSHYDRQEPLPREAVDKLCQLRQHLAGYELCQELYLATLDLHLHCRKDFWLDVVKDLWPQHWSFPLEKCDYHPCSFTEVFCDQWGAAYYCHLWARMVAADAYSSFREADAAGPAEVAAVGKRFRSAFLSRGGGMHASRVFRLFRGRDPSPAALLCTYGLKHKAPLS
ncbi:oligopeptidase A [Bacillus rossius redtenbacheri]|uniref:oligopeptidase A n=1 Tax=Bacillus rossius redtenbacheri TaxID=93214 RepID=UPI002FDCB0B1